MISNKNILEFEARQKIYNLISCNPGLHLREIDRKTKIPLSTLRYHLKHLKKRGIIKTKPEGGFSTYYITNKVGVLDQKLLHLFRQDILCKLFIKFLLCEDVEVIFKKDLRYLPKPEKWYEPSKKNYYILKHRTTLNFHLKKLLKLDLIEYVIVNRKSGYRIKHSEEIWDFLVRYYDALSNEKIKNLINWTNKHTVPSRVDPILHDFYDVFPHPYHI